MESAFLAWLAERLPPHPLLALGPGDDAAVLRTASRRDVVVTTDLLTDGVDFVLTEVDPRRVGRKALAVNLSDLAAMAARPLAAVISLALPRRGGLALAQALYEGLLPLAERFDTALAGGDTNSWDGPLVVSVTALGEVGPRGPLRRDTARIGDAVVVTGEFGGSRLGRHLDFEPRVAEALWLAEHAELHAGIDVSDGLSLDALRLAEASGVGLEFRTADVPIAAAARRWAAELADGSTPLEHAWSDGEDFELILTMPPEEAKRLVARQPLGVPLSIVGRVVAERGLWQIDREGRRAPLAARGYEHRLDA